MNAARWMRWTCAAVVLALPLGLGARPAAAGEAEEQALRDVIAQLTAEIRMLAAKVERLDKRLSELSGRVDGGAPPAPKPADGAAPGQPKPPPAALPRKPATTPEPGDLASRLPPKRPFRHSLALTSTFLEPVARTLLRLKPFPLTVITGPGPLALGALAAFDGRVPTKLPASVQLDFSSTADVWSEATDRTVVFYVDRERRSLGQASFLEERSPEGVRTFFMTVSVPLGTLLDILGGTEVGGTLGPVEFQVPEAGLEALRDLVCRLTPVAVVK